MILKCPWCSCDDVSIERVKDKSGDYYNIFTCKSCGYERLEGDEKYL